MAKPDCDDGYYKIAYELGAALLSFGFGEIEGHVLAVVLETQYGLGKRKYVELSPAKLADEWQVDRSNVHRAIGRLVAHNVLLSLGDNQYQLLKDYANWEKKGAVGRVTLWKAFVADAPRRAKALRPLPPPQERDELILEGVPGVDDEPATVPMPVVSKDNTTDTVDESPLSPKTTDRCLQRQQTVVSKDNEQGGSPRPPIGEAHAELRRGEVEKNTPLPPEGEPEVVEDGIPATIPITSVPATYDELYRWVESVTRTPYVTERLAIVASGYPIDWVFFALKCAAGKNKPEVEWPNYAGGCLRNWYVLKRINWDDVKRDTSSKHRDVGPVQTPLTAERKEEIRKRTYLGNTGTERF